MQEVYDVYKAVRAQSLGAGVSARACADCGAGEPWRGIEGSCGIGGCNTNPRHQSGASSSETIRDRMLLRCS